MKPWTAHVTSVHRQTREKLDILELDSISERGAWQRGRRAQKLIFDRRRGQPVSVTISIVERRP